MESGGGGPDEGLGAGQKYFALGLKFAGGIVLFMAGGFALDRWLGVTPLFTLVGTLGGAVLSFLSVYRQLQADAEKERRSRQDRKQ
jgi:F0F1-type ATP synthase assembly protein I